MKVKIKDIQEADKGLLSGIFETDKDNEEKVYPFLNKLPDVKIDPKLKELFDEELHTVSRTHPAESLG